jgi:hypothetical protein
MGATNNKQGVSKLIEVDTMPKKMEKSLKKMAKKKGLSGKRAEAYVYGTMRNKTKWKPQKKGGK